MKTDHEVTIVKIKMRRRSWAILTGALLTYSALATYAYAVKAREAAGFAAERKAAREVEGYIAMNIPRMPVVERRGYAELLAEAAKKNGLHHSIVASVAVVESHFVRDAVSDRDAVGIMQIVPQWWVGVAPGVQRRSDLYSPDINIQAGAWILAHYVELCGPAKMLACYESGPRGIDTGYSEKVRRVVDKRSKL